MGTVRASHARRALRARVRLTTRVAPGHARRRVPDDDDVRPHLRGVVAELSGHALLCSTSAREPEISSPARLDVSDQPASRRLILIQGDAHSLRLRREARLRATGKKDESEKNERAAHAGFLRTCWESGAQTRGGNDVAPRSR